MYGIFNILDLRPISIANWIDVNKGASTYEKKISLQRRQLWAAWLWWWWWLWPPLAGRWRWPGRQAPLSEFPAASACRRAARRAFPMQWRHLENPRNFKIVPSLLVGSLKMNTALEYSTRVVQERDRRCKKSTLNNLAYLTPLRIPLRNPVFVSTVLGGVLLAIPILIRT